MPTKTKISSPPAKDFAIQNHGTLCLFHPLTKTATSWLSEQFPAGEEHQYVGHALAVHGCLALDLVHGIRGDGLNI